LQLAAGRTGQEYNQRKQRKGAFGEDRYHTTAVESGDHLARCLVYIDTNMVRVGVVAHPGQWTYCGYHEIQEPRKKKVLIDYELREETAGYRALFEVKNSDIGLKNAYILDIID
jgi:putative transposase